MGLLLDGDDLPSSGKIREHLSERGADGRQAAMKQDQREAFAMDLVIHFETVNLYVTPLVVSVHFMRVLGSVLSHDPFSSSVVHQTEIVCLNKRALSCTKTASAQVGFSLLFEQASVR